MPTATALAALGLGQRTVRRHKEAPGHVENCPPAPLASEVSHLVAQGVVKDADVDSALSWRPDLRRVAWIKSCPTISAVAKAVSSTPSSSSPACSCPGGKVMGSPQLAPAGQKKLIDSLHASRRMIVTDASQLLGGPRAEVWHWPQRECPAGSPRMDQYRLQAAVRSATPVEHAIAFGPFRLLPTRRLLLEGEKPVRLGSRAFDILVALVERAGELVSKEELMARVWPSTFVEEDQSQGPGRGAAPGFGRRRGSNRYLATISGRGYRFVAPVTMSRKCSRPAAVSERTICRPRSCA